MQVHNLVDLLSCALEGASRQIVAYCDSHSEINKNNASTENNSNKKKSEASPVETASYLNNKPFVNTSFVVSKIGVEEEPPPPTDADAPPEKEEEPLAYYYEPDDTQEKFDSDEEADSAVVVEGVPPEHPIHKEIEELLPGFRAVSNMVEKDDFVVTPESVEIAMPVWIAFNALSRYRDDDHFPFILSYVRLYIKPVCFAAMGKEISK